MLRERAGLILRLTTALTVVSLGLSKDQGSSNPPLSSQPDRNRCTYEYPGDGTVITKCEPIAKPSESLKDSLGPHYYSQEERKGLPDRFRFLPDEVLDNILSGK